MIKPFDVDELLIRAVPDMTEAVREHRTDWPTDPMLYLLLPILFGLVTDGVENRGATGRDLARRAYGLVDRALSEGDEIVNTAFAIEMIEPLANDESHIHYPNLDFALGAAVRKEMAGMRQWSRRFSAMSDLLKNTNLELGREVFNLVGIDRDDARVIVFRSAWDELTEDQREQSFRSLRNHWLAVRGHSPTERNSGLSITDSAETGFAPLREDD